MKKKLIKKVKQNFKKLFKTKPLMVFSPGRINLIGEHTDYNEGFVFPAAINKGIVLAIQKSDHAYSHIVAMDKEEDHKFSLTEIEPIANGNWRNYILGVVSEIQERGIRLENFNLVFAGTIPGGAGMSSSAALENSIVYGLNEVFNLGLSQKEMILISQKAEHNFAGVKCGIMDQYASMFGVKKSALLLDCQKALYVIEENERVQLFATAIIDKDIKTLGELLYKSHEGLSTKYQVSCAELDFLVDKAKENSNILGARMMGGGFGGCTINLILKSEVKAFKKQIMKEFKSEFGKACSIYSVKLSDGTQTIK